VEFVLFHAVYIPVFSSRKTRKVLKHENASLVGGYIGYLALEISINTVYTVPSNCEWVFSVSLAKTTISNSV
jgi:hypothetical protein